MIRIVYDGKTYDWSRIGADNKGCWCHKNRIVHTVLDGDLTREARRQGFSERYDFSRWPPKPVKEKAVRVSGGKRKRRRTTKRNSTAVHIKISVS